MIFNFTGLVHNLMDLERERGYWETVVTFLFTACFTHAFGSFCTLIFEAAESFYHGLLRACDAIISAVFNLFGTGQVLDDSRNKRCKRKKRTMTYSEGQIDSGISNISLLMPETPRKGGKVRTSTVRKNRNSGNFCNSPIRFHPTSFNSTITESVESRDGLTYIIEKTAEIFTESFNLLKDYKIGRFDFSKKFNSANTKLSGTQYSALAGTIKFTCLLYRQMTLLLINCSEFEYSQVRELSYILCRKMYWDFDEPLEGVAEFIMVNGTTVEMPKLSFFVHKIPVSRDFPRDIMEDAFVRIHLKMRRDFNKIISQTLKVQRTDVVADVLIPFQGGPYQLREPGTWYLEPGTVGQTFKASYKKYNDFFDTWIWAEQKDETTDLIKSDAVGLDLTKILVKTGTVTVCQLLENLKESAENVPTKEEWCME